MELQYGPMGDHTIITKVSDTTLRIVRVKDGDETLREDIPATDTTDLLGLIQVAQTQFF